MVDYKVVQCYRSLSRGAMLSPTQTRIQCEELKLVCNGPAKQVSAGVAPCNMVSFAKLFRTSVARQVSRKVEPLSTSATARNGRSAEKKSKSFTV